MAKILYGHPKKRGYRYHIFTDLDFWDARRILRDFFPTVSVRRNFGDDPSGDDFPTQVVSEDLAKELIGRIEYRLRKAIPSPPRHVVVRGMVFEGVFSFDPSRYYPSRWSREQIEHFTWHRLPLEQSALCNPYHTVRLEWRGSLLVVVRQRREEKYDPKITNLREDHRNRFIPSAF